MRRRIGCQLLLAASVGTATMGGSSLDARSARESRQTTIAAPGTSSFFGLTPQFAVSPDGQQVVAVANVRGAAPSLWLRRLNSADARRLPETEQASYPFWSPDSRFIGFFAAGKLMTTSIGGGSPVVVCDAPAGRGGTWNADAVIVFASGIGDPLRKVAAAGGAPTAITVVETPRENSHRWPQFLPDGRHVLFWAGAGTASPSLKIASLDSRDVVAIGPSDSNGGYGAGHIFFKNGNALVAQPFDPIGLRLNGDRVSVAEPISTDAGSFFASFSVSTAGTLLYTRGTARPFVLTWFDRAGTKIGTVGPPGQYTNVSLSPDDARLAVSLTAGSPPNRDIWIVDAAQGRASRFTEDPAVDATPIWSPDGSTIVFSSQRAGPYQIYRRASGGGPSAQSDELLLKSETASIATDWSRDGRFIMYTRTAASTGLDVWMLPLFGDRTPIPFLATPASEDNASISPDGRWVAYQSNEGGRDEVYVRSLPASKIAVQVSRNGGTQPLWRGDGKEVFFLASDGSVMSAAVDAAQSFRADTPRTLVPPTMTLVLRRAYAVNRDGQRVLVPVLDESNPPVITVVMDWARKELSP